MSIITYLNRRISVDFRKFVKFRKQTKFFSWKMPYECLALSGRLCNVFEATIEVKEQDLGKRLLSYLQEAILAIQ